MWIVSGSYDQKVKIWDSANGLCRNTLGGHIDTVSAVAWSPDGKLVASGSGSCAIKIWDLTGQCTKGFKEYGGYASTIKWSLNSTQIAWRVGGADILGIWSRADQYKEIDESRHCRNLYLEDDLPPPFRYNDASSMASMGYGLSEDKSMDKHIKDTTSL
jgi:WD40 repeat protein